jgi:cytochrome c551/c552
VSPIIRVTASGLFAAAAVVAAVVWSDDGEERTNVPAASASSGLDGRAVFEAKGCVVCHERTDTGPALTRLSEVAGDRVEGLDAAEYVEQSILQPQAFRAPGGTSFVQMPTLAVTPAELAALVDYLLDS